MVPTVTHVAIDLEEGTCSCFAKTKKPVQEHVQITSTDVKVHSAVEPVLNEQGFWEITIDGKKYGLTAIEHTSK